MQPRGKVKALIAAMEAQPDKALWMPSECCAAMGVPEQSLFSRLRGAVNQGWIYKHDLGGRRTGFSLQQQEGVEDVEAAPFNAALWADGDLVLYGLTETTDGGHILPSADVAALRRLLGVSAP